MALWFQLKYSTYLLLHLFDRSESNTRFFRLFDCSTRKYRISQNQNGAKIETMAPSMNTTASEQLYVSSTSGYTLKWLSGCELMRIDLDEQTAPICWNQQIIFCIRQKILDDVIAGFLVWGPAGTGSIVRRIEHEIGGNSRSHLALNTRSIETNANGKVHDNNSKHCRWNSSHPAAASLRCMCVCVACDKENLLRPYIRRTNGKLCIRKSWHVLCADKKHLFLWLRNWLACFFVWRPHTDSRPHIIRPE